MIFLNIFNIKMKQNYTNMDITIMRLKYNTYKSARYLNMR